MKLYNNHKQSVYSKYHGEAIYVIIGSDLTNLKLKYYTAINNALLLMSLNIQVLCSKLHV